MEKTEMPKVLEKHHSHKIFNKKLTEQKIKKLLEHKIYKHN